MEEALTLFSDREDFAYFCGCAANSAKALSLGADGIVPSVGNYLPKIYNDLFEAGISGNTEIADDLQAKTIDNLTLGESLAGLKVIMKMYGLCETYMLPPLTELEEETVINIQNKVRDIINKYK